MSDLSLPCTVPISAAGVWRLLRLLGASGLALLLNACAVTQPYPGPAVQREPVRTSPAQPPAQRPAIQAQPTRSPSRPVISKTHPRYAPPPDVASHWDSRLGVYVVEGRSLYYRERRYYRWSAGWYSAGRPDGPWESIAEPSVPPRLRSHHP